MTDKEINSLLFRGVIAKLANLSSAEGDSIDRAMDGEQITFWLGFTPRPTERFAHNYERDNFLHKRDRFIVMRKNDIHTVLIRYEQMTERITIYRKPIDYMFGKDAPRAFSILEKLVHKFYDDIHVEDVLQQREIDANSGVGGSNNRRVYYELS